MTTASKGPKAGTVDMKLEVAVIPVSDVDRAKRFYENLGWRLMPISSGSMGLGPCNSRLRARRPPSN